jgi:BirA family biotin operon repressor/biotin-[acetyl-CoA-carboxylase] ligase
MSKIIIGHPIIRLEEVDSTNVFASRLIKHDTAMEGTVILAEYQHQGRGQRGNSWESEKGMNLTFSFILRPDFLEAQKQFYLLMSVSLGIVDALYQSGLKPFIKWPNDIFISNRKIGGILIENFLSGNKILASIVGIGINVNQTHFARFKATSLYIETGNEFNRNELFQVILTNLNKWLNALYRKEFELINNAYLQHLLRYNKWAEYTVAGGKFGGCIRGILEEGRLMVEDERGEIRYYGFGEIEYIF